MPSLQVILIFIIPLSILFLRYSRKLLGIIPGEITGLYSILLSSFISIAPFCLICGLLFSICSALYYDTQRISEESKAVGHVYLFEATGAAIAGLLASFILLRYLSSFSIILIVMSLNFLSAVYYLFDPVKERTKIFFPPSKIHFCIRITLYLILIFVFFRGISQKIDRKSAQLKWGNYPVIETVNSIYGNISVVNLDNTYHFYNNGLLMFSYPDFFNSEESVHFAMLQNMEARDVLMIGGGLNGSLIEILKYKNIKNIDYVELDPALIKTAEKYLPDKFFNNDKINYHFGDGRNFIRNCKKQYDIIIINLPNPYTIQLNRFYTIEFFHRIRNILKPEGVFSCRLSSAENYISNTLKDYLRSIYIPLSDIFDQIIAIPGESAIIITRKGDKKLIDDPMLLSRFIKEENLNNRLINEHYLPVRMSIDRMKYLKDILQTDESIFQNSDLSPIAYYFDMVLWSTHFSKRLRNIFLSLNSVNLKFVFIVAIILLYGFFVYFFFTKRKKDKKYLYLAILITGFSAISLELIILLLFQILYGVLYYQIAILLTAFMIGIGIGSYPANKGNLRKSYLTLIQFCFAVFPAFLILSFTLFAVFSNTVLTFIGKHIIFTLLACIAGGLSGAHFILSNRIYKVSQKKRDWGKIYAIDLIGSAAGALLISTILIPILGIKFILAIICGINLFASLILWVGLKE